MIRNKIKGVTLLFYHFLEVMVALFFFSMTSLAPVFSTKSSLADGSFE
jgi:type II secretory pathway component PulJ